MHRQYWNQKKRNAKLKALGFPTYADYLKSNHWHERRAAYRSGHPPVCRYCGRAADDLHHVTYDNMGAERDEDLMWLCRDHHEELHKWGVLRPPTEAQVQRLRFWGVTDAAIARLTRGTATRLVNDMFNCRVSAEDVNNN